MGGGEEHPFSRILVVGPRSSLASHVSEHVDGERVRAVEAHEAFGVACSWRPTLALLGAADARGVDLLRALLARDAGLPVVVAAGEPFARLALRAGAFAVIPERPEAGHVRAALAEVLHEDAEAPFR